MSSAVFADCDFSEMPPRSWLTQEVSLEEIHEEEYAMCLSLQRAIPNIACTKNTANIFKHNIEGNSKIYRFSNSRQCVEKLAGVAGWVLETNGVLIEYIIRERS